MQSQDERRHSELRCICREIVFKSNDKSHHETSVASGYVTRGDTSQSAMLKRQCKQSTHKMPITSSEQGS